MPLATATDSHVHQMLEEMNHGALSKALQLLPLRMNTINARAQLLKIFLQEGVVGGEIHRRQMANGPARSLLQFERGGISALISHPATKQYCKDVCAAQRVPCSTDAIYQTLACDDVLAFALGRLNLYWSPKSLPAFNDDVRSFDYYLDCWRPGAFKTHPEACWRRWSQNHADVLAYLKDLP